MKFSPGGGYCQCTTSVEFLKNDFKTFNIDVYESIEVYA
jgi:hypothetical protein